MIDLGKRNLLGVLIDAVDYEGALRRIENAARNHQPFAMSALAVHGVMTGYSDPEHRVRLNKFDLVTPDGQPVRWAVNLLHGTNLPDRVYGPNLTLMVCEMAAREGFGIYLYGSTLNTLEKLQEKLKERFPTIKIVGAEPSKFRTLSILEKQDVIERIRMSGAQITLVGLGCPRQEVWAYEYRDALSMPIMAVGAAFDFHAGTLKQAPSWMQDRGLEWFYRFTKEPKRLWKRYMYLNPWYVSLVAQQYFKLRHFSPSEHRPVKEISYG